MPDHEDNEYYSLTDKIKPKIKKSSSILDDVVGAGRKAIGKTIEILGDALNIIPGVGSKKIVPYKGSKHWSDERKIRFGYSRVIKTNSIQKIGRNIKKNNNKVYVENDEDTSAISLSSDSSLERINITPDKSPRVAKNIPNSDKSRI